MSLFDWLTSGLKRWGVDIPWFSGSYSSTMGDALSVYFGGRHTHIFGSEIKLVCDPEDMALGALAESMPLFTALLAGVGGQTTFVYGTNCLATYVGPKVEIRRAPTAGKTSDNIIARDKGAGTGGKPDPVDTGTCVAVATMSILLCATAAALELALHFKYPAWGSGDELAEEKYGTTPDKLVTSNDMIADRLMALLKELECKGTWAGFGEMFSKEALADVLLAEALATVFFPPAGIALYLTAKIAQNVANTSESVGRAAR